MYFISKNKMWHTIPGCVYYKSNDFNFDPLKPRLAMFDIDYTLITPKNGKNPYSLHQETDSHNYVYLGPIFDKFKALKNKGYTIALITNQMYWNRATQEYHTKFENIQKDFEKELGWSPYIYIATNEKFVKPNIAIFVLFAGHLSDGFVINSTYLQKTTPIQGIETPNFFYCGDASGKKDSFPPYRWSSVDRNYAYNISEAFNKYFNQSNLCKYIRPISFFGGHTPITRAQQELVIMVGNPGSGKSSTSFRFKKRGYKVCVGEIVKNKLLDCVSENLHKGYSVIVDSMNYSRKGRERYIKLAQELKLPVRILWFIRDGRPFNTLRGYNSEKNTVYAHRKQVPDVVYNIYSKKFEEPTKEEGEIEIVI
jgi:DNA 3'-phosphatase